MDSPTEPAESIEPGAIATFLGHLGADAETCADLLARQAASTGGARAGRVRRAERVAAEVLTPGGTFHAGWDEPVCTGDWVLVSPPRSGERNGDARIVGVLPRRRAVVRRSTDVTRPQVLAANVEECWIVVAANRMPPPSWTERTLVVAWDSGADPVVVVTKADLLATPSDGRDAGAGPVGAAVAEMAGTTVPVIAVSSVAGAGIAALAGRLGPGRSAALLGASGVGKSSLVNALAGDRRAAVGAVRASDGKGRHTTTWRQLAVLPAGGAVIDTPGLRGIGMWVDEGGVDAAFEDILALSGSCRFGDCHHDREPGCAVRAAIATGVLAQRRLDSFAELTAEAAAAGRAEQSRLAAGDRRPAATTPPRRARR